MKSVLCRGRGTFPTYPHQEKYPRYLMIPTPHEAVPNIGVDLVGVLYPRVVLYLHSSVDSDTVPRLVEAIVSAAPTPESRQTAAKNRSRTDD